MIDPEYPESAPPEHRELREIISRAVKSRRPPDPVAAEAVRGVLYRTCASQRRSRAPPLSLSRSSRQVRLPRYGEDHQVSAMRKIQLPRMRTSTDSRDGVEGVMRAATDEQHRRTTVAQKMMQHASTRREGSIRRRSSSVST